MQPTHEAPPWFLPLFFPCFVLIWCIVCARLSFKGGWYHLAKAFPERSLSNAKRFFSPIAMGFGWFPVHYSAFAVSIRVGQEGIGLTVFPIFRAFQAPMVIPWNAFECRKEKFWFRSCAAVYITQPTNRILFMGRAGKYIYDYYTTTILASAVT